MNAISDKRTRWGLNIFFLVLAWIFASSLTIPILPLFYITPPYLSIFAISALTMVVLSLATWRARNVFVFSIILLIGGVWFLFLSSTPADARILGWAELASDGFNTLNEFATEKAAADDPSLIIASEAVLYYQGIITTLVTIAVTAFSYVILGRAKWPWVMVLGIVGVIIANLTVGIETHVFWLVPAVIIAMLVFVWSNRIENQGSSHALRHMLQLSLQTGVPLILAMALVLMITPRLDYYDVYSPTLQKLTDDVMSLLPQNYQDNFEIYNFSIRQAGYYPLGDRLGGPLDLTNDPMIEVWGDPGDLLKGSSADIYNGKGWTNTMTNPHYRFNSAFNTNEQEEVMSTEYPLINYLPEGAQETVLDSNAYAIRPLIDNVQVVFGDGVLTNVATHREEPTDFYFNRSGLVYAHDLFDGAYAYWGESFGVESSVIPGLRIGSGTVQPGQPTAGDIDFAMGQLIRTNEIPVDEDLAFDNYLQLPDLPQYRPGGTVYDLSESLVRGTRTDYEAVLRLFNYLGRNPEFTYSVDVAIPGDDEEFVSHFLETKVGYCTYYGTALTMMARSVGIPARYVEGFSVSPEAQDLLELGDSTDLTSVDVETGELDDYPSAVLTARNAHAWTEVYIRGIGWVPMDPTPGGAGGTSLPIIHEEEYAPEDQSPTPTPLPGETGTPTPTPLPEEDLTPSPEPSESDPLDPDEELDTGQSFLAVLGRLLMIILIIAAVIGSAYLYYHTRKQRYETFHSPDLLAAKVGNKSDHIITYWHQILKLLALLPEGQAPGRLSLAEQMDWYISSNPTIPSSLHDDLREAVLLGQSAYFSNHEPSDADITNLAATFDETEALLEAELGQGKYLFKRLLVPRSFTLSRRDTDQ